MFIVTNVKKNTFKRITNVKSNNIYNMDCLEGIAINKDSIIHDWRDMQLIKNMICQVHMDNTSGRGCPMFATHWLGSLLTDVFEYNVFGDNTQKIGNFVQTKLGSYNNGWGISIRTKTKFTFKC